MRQASTARRERHFGGGRSSRRLFACAAAFKRSEAFEGSMRVALQARRREVAEGFGYGRRGRASRWSRPTRHPRIHKTVVIETLPTVRSRLETDQ